VKTTLGPCVSHAGSLCCSGTWFTDSGKMIQVGRVNVAGTESGASCCTASDGSCCTGADGCTQSSGNGQCGINGGWVTVDLHTHFPDDEVSVLPHVQTYNDPSFVKARMAPYNMVAGSFSAGFQVALEEIGSSTAGIAAHGMEAIGWMAFQHAADSVGGDVYMADTTDMRITSDPATGGIAFCQGFFPRPPLFFATLASYSGWDAAELRLTQPTTATQASVFIEEEGCSDDEVLHVAETVSFFAIDHTGNHKIRATASAPPRSGSAQGGLDAGAGADCGGPAVVECTDHNCWMQEDDNFCESSFSSTMDEINDVCCQTHGMCDGGFPTSCTVDCAGLWIELWERCDAYILELFPSAVTEIQSFSDSCDSVTYGGTCTDEYYTQGTAMLAAACPSDGASCPTDCRELLMSFGEACQDRLASDASQTAHMTQWRFQCLPGGNGH
jgi:hypothetical protein